MHLPPSALIMCYPRLQLYPHDGHAADALHRPSHTAACLSALQVLATTLAPFHLIYKHRFCSASHERLLHFCGGAPAIRLESLQGPPHCSDGALADASGRIRKGTFPFELRYGTHSDGDVPAPKIKMQGANSGPKPSLACGAEASPEHDTANFD